MAKILVIDDDLDICVLLKRFLKRNNFEVEIAHSGKKGLAAQKKDAFDVVLCDYRLPDMDGLEMIPALKQNDPDSEIIVITGYSDVRLAVKVMKMGAFEYVTKPIHQEEILANVKKAIEKRNSKSESSSKSTTKSKKSSTKPAPKSKYIEGTGVQAQRLRKLISLVAPTDMTVVITGESGTGKEVTATHIHEASKRSDQPMVAVDCGALPKELAGSILFGHLKGSFTGALNDKIGHFEAANGGTLFLDEVGNLSYENQIKLLRVLQERKIQRIGESKSKNVDVRIIAATNEDLKAMVQEGKFREDLYYRLNEFSVELPSLRERKQDIVEIATFFMQEAAGEFEKEVNQIDDNVIAAFENYSWPGNIRELKNIMKRATLLASEQLIDLNTIPVEIQNPALYEFDEGDDSEILELRKVTERAEKKAILQALKKTGMNKSKTAELLKVDRKTLYNKINSFGIDLS
ncbi:MAG: sigma-54-dependent Fis family transcriptional regulator [Flavobacteriales bacterium]|nr:sigma-54-dependent Fis family transcriptional regulator [Flavobacteriales bacterium]